MLGTALSLWNMFDWQMIGRKLLITVVFCAVVAACDSTPSAPQPSPVPTSLPGLGTVKGILLELSTHNPIRERLLLLAKIHPSEALSVAALDPATPLKDTTDGEGRFVITNVPPDSYALGMLLPTGYVLIHDPGTQKEKIMTVKAGDIVDLGEYAIDPVVPGP